jgi:SAM-dependent methyltransferase
MTSSVRFNAEAAAWDKNPDVHRASALAHKSIISYFPSSSSYDVLEIGCGTGLLSFLVTTHVRSLTAVDAAEGMINALNLKLESQPDVKNLRAVFAMLEDPEDPLIRADPVENNWKEQVDPATLPVRKFDLILSHLVLHHIPDLESTVATMFGCLKPGGSVALTDFEDFGPEARKFHPEARMNGVCRHGIQRKEMQRMLTEAGFVDVNIATAFTMEKGVESVPGEGVKGEKMDFPFLICMGRKP